MVFRWLRQRRRRRLLAEPFPSHWNTIFDANFRAYAQLSDAERGKLQRDVQVFVAEKNWEGVYGLEMTEEIQVTVAAQACYMLLGLDLSCFDRTISILVYPDAYAVPQQFTLRGGGVVEGRSDRLGENWYRGPIVLSWPDVLAGGRRETRGSNLVIHEFAHELDTLNGSIVDGTPPLPDPETGQRWDAVMSREYARLCQECRFGRPTLLDCYGAENRGEFFAVASEVFFQEPVRLSRRHPDLYQLLCAAYRQDPAARVLRRQAGSVEPQQSE